MRIVWFLLTIIVMAVGFGVVAVLALAAGYLVDHGMWYIFAAATAGPPFCMVAWYISGEWTKSAERKKVGK